MHYLLRCSVFVVTMRFVSAVDEAMTGIAQHGPLAVALFTANDFFTYDKGKVIF